MRHNGISRRYGARAALLLATAALAGPLAAIAEENDAEAFVTESLATAAERNPDGLFRVIVQASDGANAARVADEVADRLDDNSTDRDALTARFESITGVAATLTGTQVLDLARDGAIQAITPDVPMVTSDVGVNHWLPETGLLSALRTNLAQGGRMPTIALVDSGIQLRRAFAERVVGQISMTQLTPNASGDGRGHGTFVAGIAAAAAPGARLVAIDVVDDNGKAMTSDVIAAADWILNNKDRYAIRVANFSLHAARPSSFRTDPLDRAVERLWLGGVVVVTSAGNYRSGSEPSGVPFAPANDPFVITVGATDLGSASGGADDFNAPWSAFGRTHDGFLKPDLSAPGRGLIGPVPESSTLAAEQPEKVVAPGWMRLSGTSFSAPIVAGAAAQLLGAHPAWTPDQVKGALMASARTAGGAEQFSVGTGQVEVAAALRLTQPPNPNRALMRFLIDDPAGGPIPVFDAASWDSASSSDVSWDSASWTDVSWTDASWADASWTD